MFRSTRRCLGNRPLRISKKIRRSHGFTWIAGLNAGRKYLGQYLGVLSPFLKRAPTKMVCLPCTKF